MPFPPEAYLIGAQRAGTTSLAAMLDQHPDIVVSTPKEPDFFSVHWERGLDWYKTCFRRPDATLIDASVSYSMTPLRPHEQELSDEVPRRIHTISPKAKFVYVIREPAERCYSAYWLEIRAGRERCPLHEAVEESRYYVMASYYHKQITPYLKFFPLDRFFFLRFEDFVADPLAAAQACCRFLGVRREELLAPAGLQLNQSFLYNGFGRRLRDLIGEDWLKSLSRVVSDALPSSLHPYVKRLVSHPIPKLSSADRLWLAARFAEDARAFTRLTGVKIVDVTELAPERV